MSWWTHPGWKETCCDDCGVNIWDSGGDPDHGVCYECFMVRWEREHPPSENAHCAITAQSDEKPPENQPEHTES